MKLRRKGISLLAIGGGLLLAFLAIDRSGAMRAPWGKDEPQRIAESYFSRLFLAGDWSNPAWFAYGADYSHPPANKYFFGAALALHGVPLPPDLALPRMYEAGTLVGNVPPRSLEPVFEPARVPARRASLLANLLACGAVMLFMLRQWGLAAALVPAVLLSRHYLYSGLLAQARSDALETFAAAATLPILAILWEKTERRPIVWVAWGALLGAFSAVSFQTRLNGLLVLGAAGAVLLIDWVRRRQLGSLIAAGSAVLVCVGLTMAMNPFYWADPSPGTPLAGVYAADGGLPAKAAKRFTRQVVSLQEQLDHQAEEWRLRTLSSRVAFVGNVLTSGKAGLAAAAGALLVCLFALKGSDAEKSTARLTVIWSGLMIAVFTAWLPLSWDPYCLMILPAWMAAGSVGLVLALVRISRVPAAAAARSRLAEFFGRGPGFVSR